MRFAPLSAQRQIAEQRQRALRQNGFIVTVKPHLLFENKVGLLEVRTAVGTTAEGGAAATSTTAKRVYRRRKTASSL